MTTIFISLLAFVTIVGHSNAAYCVCNSGAGDAQLQKNIDYACASGADCTPITQGGSCYNPNTLKDHCNYAVNSYYQKKGPNPLNCDFSGSATVTSSSPSQSSSCVYPTGSGGTPTTGTPPSTGTPSTGTPSTGTPSTGTPSTGTPSTGTPSTGTGTGSGNGMGTPTPINTVPGSTPGSYGLGPSGGGGLDNSYGSAATTLDHTANLPIAIALAILSLGLMFTSA